MMIKIVLVFLWTQLVLSHSVQQPLIFNKPIQKPKVAIVGAGAGGSSAAYHLQKFTSHGYDITIFERNGYIGGRSTTIDNYDPDFQYEIELGGSIFVGVNKILVNAAREFNLTLIEGGSFSSKFGEELFEDSLGIWNGTDFIFTTSKHESKWRLLGRLLWKYRLSPIRTYRLVRSLVNTFLSFYYEDQFPFTGLNEVNLLSGFDSLTNSTGEEYLLSQGVSSEFIHEFIEAVTRVNYRSNINDIHGLETLVSLAADEKIYRVKGGNYKIFEKFIESSQAKLNLKSTVKKISKNLEGKWKVDFEKGDELESETFDHIILASPFYQSGIEFDQSINLPIKVEYRELYASYFETNRTQKLNHPIFKNYTVPEEILTSQNIDGDKPLPFFSVSIVHYNDKTDKIIYKVFSPGPIDDQFLKDNLFDETVTDFEHVNVIFNKKWNPYPHLVPVSQFTNFEIDENVWYLNTIESFISTMETSALAGANVAGLISLGRNTTEVKPY